MKKGKLIGIIIGIIVLATIVYHNSLETSKSNENKIIGFLPLTGKLASAGISEGRGIEMVVADWNQKGGLLGKKLEYSLEDTKADTTEALSIYQRNNISENHPLAIYSIASGVALNLKKFTENDKIPHIGAVGAKDFSIQSNNTLRNFDSSKIVGQELIKQIEHAYSDKKIIYFFENSDHSISCKEAMNNYLKKKAATILDFDPIMNNFRDLILKANPKNQDNIIIITGVGSYLGILIRQLREYGYTGAILGDANLNIAGVHGYAGESMKGVIILDYQQYDDNKYCQHLNESYIKQYGTPLPDVGFYLAYQGTDTLLAFYEAKGTHNIKNLTQEIEGFTHEGCLGTVIVHDGELNYPLSFREIQ